MPTKKPKGLGRGLEALLGPAAIERSSEASSDQTPRELPVDRLQAGKYQPRAHMDEAGLAELAESIKAQGVIQPVLVRAVGGGSDDGAPRFEIIAGERRVRAARLAGLAAVPVIVRDVSDAAAAAMALIENIQRQDLNPLEEARGLRRLIDEFGLTHEAAAAAVGRSRSAASNLLRLLNLGEPVQQMLLAGQLEMGHARALLALDKAAQARLAHQLVAKRLSVREAERLVARASKAPSRAREAEPASAASARALARIEQRLSDRLAAPVRIVAARGKSGAAGAGEIGIGYASLDELNGLLARLGYESE